MASIITDLKETFRNGNIHVRLIFINAAVFVLMAFINVINVQNLQLFEWLEMPASISCFLHQPWSLLTYMFMHKDFLHILFNMIGLYWFGELFLQFFSAKHLRGLFIFGGCCGGLFFMAAYNLFPYLEPAISYTYLAGASASVLAILTATAYREPDYPVRLLFLGTIKLKYVALIVIGWDLLFIKGYNAGTHITHLGGELAGLTFTAMLYKGHDLTHYINLTLDSLLAVFNSKPKKPKMKVNYGKRQNDYDYNARKKAQNEEIDRILDKLRKSGYESLTAEEKKSLFDASKR